MNELPRGWCAARLGDVTAPAAGSRQGSSGLQYLGLENVESETTRVLGTTLATGLRSPAKPFEPGDVLYARLRPYLNKVCAPDFSGLASSEFLVFKRRPWLEPRFLMYALNAPGFVRFANSLNQGVGRPRVRWEQIASYNFPLPPLDEQRRIVARIEEQLSRLQAANAFMLDVQRRLDQLRQKTFADAFPEDGPAVEIESIAGVGSGATPLRSRAEYWDGGSIPWVTSGQLNEPYVGEPAALITELALRETNVKLWPAGTLLVALYGEGKTRGRCAELRIEATTNQACAAIVLDEGNADRTYVRRFFDARYLANRRLAAGGVQPNLSLGLIRTLKIPLPPLDQQRSIVADLERELSAVAVVERATAGASDRGSALRQSILMSAFRGELVVQDPSDEPASVLLEQIAVGRAASSRPARRGRATMAK